MSINAENPFSFDLPGLIPPQDQDPTTNQGQAAVVAKQTHGQGTGATTLAHDTIQSGGETVATQQFSNLDQSALNTVIPQQPVLPQLDTTTSPATLFAVSELIITSGFAVPTEQAPSSRDEVQGEAEGSPSGTVHHGSMALANPAIQERNKKDQGSSQGDDKENVPTSAPAGSAKAPAGSDWLKPSGYVTAMINMLSYVNDTTRQETTLLKLTIAMINIMWDMTLTAAQLQRDIGEKEAQSFYVKAAMAAVQMAVAVCTVTFTFVAMGVAAKGMGGKQTFDAKGNPMMDTTGKPILTQDTAGSRSAQMILNSNVLTQLGTIVNSGTEMVGNIALAQIAIAKANLEAALKEEEGRITQTKMLLDQMMQSLEQLHSLVDQFNRYIAEISKQRGDSLGISRAS